MKKHGIGYHGNVLVGLNGETYQDIQHEIESMPKQYHVFPTLVHQFIGTHEGGHRSINHQECDYLADCFKDYVISQGKYCYPELSECAA